MDIFVQCVICDHVMATTKTSCFSTHVFQNVRVAILLIILYYILPNETVNVPKHPAVAFDNLF